MIADLFELIPNKLKQQVLDTAVDVIASQAEAVGGQSMAHKIRQLRSDAAFTSAYETGLKKAIERFVNEYELEDEDLVAAIARNQELFADKQVQSALLAMVSQPGKYLNTEQDTLAQSFDSVLPERKNRERVDKAITYLLRCLAEEMWHLPELQPIYTLQFARMTAEATREQVALQKAQLAALSSLSDGVRGALLQLTDSIASQKQLSSGNAGQQLPLPRVYHNLPQPDYGEFVGREEELIQIFKLLRPYPQSRHHLIVIDGIGGIGKSTLALEVAHRCLHVSQQTAVAEEAEPTSFLSELRQILIDRFSEDELRTLCFDMALDYDMLPGQGKGGKARELVTYLDRRRRLDELEESIRDARLDIKIGSTLAEKNATSLTAEQFDAIIWTSAKSNMLRAEGITPRRQIVRTLEDVYTGIAIALQQEEIIRAKPEEQGELVRRALTIKKTLLIVDNLETVDDESVLTFLRELPAPSKAIVTTRHRIDVAFAVRLEGMSWKEAKTFIRSECRKRNLQFESQQTPRLLFEHTGGLPLGLVWSIAQIAIGYGESIVLNRLSKPSEDLAQFCFKVAIDSIKDEPSYILLLALSLFAIDVSREALGEITEIQDEIRRDKGLVHLENLSLISKTGSRFRMLPLTRYYVQAENVWNREMGKFLQANWLKFLIGITKQSGHSHWRWLNFDLLLVEGENILAAIDWALQKDDSATVLDLAPAIYWYLDAVGRWSDAIRYANATIHMAQGVGDYLSLAGILRQLGWIYGQMGDFKESLSFLKQGIRACDSIKDYQSDKARVPILITWGQVLRKSGNFAEAESVYNEAKAIIEEQHLGGERPEALEYELGKLARDRGDWHEAKISFTKIVTWSENREAQNLAFSPDLVMGARGSLALVLYHLGDHQNAEEECLTSMSFFRENGGRGYYAMLQFRLSLIKEAQGKLLDALDLAKSALDTCYQLGMQPEIPDLEALVARLQIAINEN